MLSEAFVLGAVAASLPAEAFEGLYQSPDWLMLKNVWKMLGRLEPVDGYSMDFPMETAKGDSVIAVLRGLFQGTSAEYPDLNAALVRVVELTVERTERLSRMNPMLMTRMMPSWTATTRDGLVFDFESRLTALSQLVSEGEVTAQEFIAARDSLLDRAMMFSMLELVNESGGIEFWYYPYPESSAVNPDTILKRLDMSYQAALDSLNRTIPVIHTEHYKMVVEQHEEFLVRYEEFRRIEPVYRQLLRELMEAQR